MKEHNIDIKVEGTWSTFTVTGENCTIEKRKTHKVEGAPYEYVADYTCDNIDVHRRIKKGLYRDQPERGNIGERVARKWLWETKQRLHEEGESPIHSFKPIFMKWMSTQGYELPHLREPLKNFIECSFESLRSRHGSVEEIIKNLDEEDPERLWRQCLIRPETKKRTTRKRRVTKERRKVLDL